MSVRIITADCREALADMPDESVHCVVTSPPYWGLRDYGVEGQLGLEPTLGEHLAVMVDIFREVRRVLRKDGTCWVNYGDCYATSPAGNKDIPHGERFHAKRDDRSFVQKPFSTVGPIYAESRPSTSERGFNSGSKQIAKPPSGRVMAGGALKPKDLCMMSNRLAIALQDDGWWVRSEIVWEKPNPMPESTKDRPTSSHEKIWLLTKSPRYFYDGDAVREPVTGNVDANGFRGGSYVGGEPGPRKKSGNKERKHDHDGGRGQAHSVPWEGSTRNLRNVWAIATRPFPEAHFATFPPDLVEPCIKAGCPEGGTVLDPFGGAGTTGLVADRLKRDAILIELNPEYAEMARARIAGDCPMFSEVSA